MLLPYLTVMHKVACRLDNLVSGGAVQSCADLVLQLNNMLMQKTVVLILGSITQAKQRTADVTSSQTHQEERLLGANDHFTCRRCIQLVNMSQ
jgi:hypothetical protein